MITEINTEDLRSRVQETLDQLFSERLIPFALTAYEVRTDDYGEHEVHFRDSRIHSIRFPDTEPCDEAVRAAVLDRLKELGGPGKGFGIH